MDDNRSNRAGGRIVLSAIGYARTPFVDTSQISRGIGATHSREGTLEIDEIYAEGLTDIEGFSHLFVLWVFDRSDGYELLSKPPTDSRAHGVFASRSPRRPNPLALTVVRLLGRDGPHGRFLRVRGVDMLDGSPIVDIKPYLSSVPVEELQRGWIAEVETQSALGERRRWSDKNGPPSRKK